MTRELQGKENGLNFCEVACKHKNGRPLVLWDESKLVQMTGHA